jgi:hypothetical protein
MRLDGLKIAVPVQPGVTLFDAEGADDDVGSFPDRDAQGSQLAIVKIGHRDCTTAFGAFGGLSSRPDCGGRIVVHAPARFTCY